jgi:UDP-N-acetylglucosamine 2-epimerase (non-hydrolysing)/GDP/UDP-N,N'-diacetylbacillosamine 2-epimerase (hydrolysing)
MVMVLGDRFEMMSAVPAALFYKIPVAHLHGGEVTEGAYDDCIRHAITKMSHLHFTSTEVYRHRVIQLGEAPQRVFNVGAIGVENIKQVPLMSKEELEDSLDFKLTDKCLLVTYHPVTLEDSSAADQSEHLLQALDKFTDYKVIFTMPNSDTDGRVIMQKIEAYVSEHTDRCKAFKSLGLKRYLSALQYVTAVVGNSSSGIIEVPSFGIPTLNIGDRQKGRLAADSVHHCGTLESEITHSLSQILQKESLEAAKRTVNPYEKEGTVGTIVKVLKGYPLEHLVQKSFYNL